ncbi:MAG TPA: phosphatase PAP2 family protein [Candidatus Thermoplasmatota archaeon]|nr:phosphatase PAP2 family protein [Candidatus Thermoplasmatota archaeon]
MAPLHVPPRVRAALPWGLAGAAALFALLAHQVATEGPWVSVDGRLEAWLAEGPAEVRSGLGLLATLPGAQPLLAAVIAACVVALWLQGRRGLAAGVGATALAGEAAVFLLKEAFHRTRAAVGESGHSFPSGHATRTTLDYGLVVLLALGPWRARMPRWARRAAVPAWLALVAVVDAGRVVAGHHWLGDVLAGNALGALLLGAFALAWDEAGRRGRLSGEGGPSAP